MNQPAKYSCPHCKNLFSISNPSLYGKQISCPTCKKPVVISAPSPTPPAQQPAPSQPQPQNPFPQQPAATNPFPQQPAATNPFPQQPPGANPFGNLPPGGVPAQPGQFAVAPGPPRSPNQTAASKKKKKKKKSKSLAPLIVISSIVGILLPVGLTTFFLLKKGGADGNVVDMTWLPENTEVLMHIKVSRLVNSSLYKEHLANDPQFTSSLSEMREETGLSLSDVESVTLGALDGESMSGAVAVVRLSKDVDVSKMSKLNKSEVNGFSVYEGADSSLLLADSRTLVIAKTPTMDAVANRGAVIKRFPQFDFADSGQDFFVSMVPTDKSIFKSKNPTAMMMGGAPAGFSNAIDAFENGANAVTIGGSLSGSNLGLKFQADMLDAATSTKLKDGLGESITEGRKTFKDSSAMLPAGLVPIIEDVLASLNVEQSSSEVDVTLQLPVGKLIEFSNNLTGGNSLPGFGNFMNF